MKLCLRLFDDGVELLLDVAVDHLKFLVLCKEKKQANKVGGNRALEKNQTGQWRREREGPLCQMDWSGTWMRKGSKP